MRVFCHRIAGMKGTGRNGRYAAWQKGGDRTRDWCKAVCRQSVSPAQTIIIIIHILIAQRTLRKQKNLVQTLTFLDFPPHGSAGSVVPPHGQARVESIFAHGRHGPA